jgi:glycosyltransferase involved in cell wall biosynthesis
VAPPLELRWVGPRPAWLEHPEAALELDGVTLVDAAAAVVHLAPGASLGAAEAKKAPGRPGVVVDVGARAASLPQQDLESADAVLVDSAWDAGGLAARQPTAAEKITVAPAPVDLERFAPQAGLLQAHGSLLKRFKRYHRLGQPCLLFVGPYTPKGGLDLAIEATYLLRELFPDVRLAAIPLGSIDHRFLDACERRALGLGHRGIVEWRVENEELPFWYATASVVCAPWRAWADTLAPLRFAAAAGRPFVGSDVGPLRAELATASDWGELMPSTDVQALVAACGRLFGEPARADERGARARAHAEETVSPKAAARRLAECWRSVASGARASEHASQVP